ncbi:MAG TPA: OB-fold nucleic acid binding domain-containing protein [Acidisarcina sp.]
MKELFVADLVRHENQTVTSFFAASSKQLRTKKGGEHYLALILADRTGQLECRMWDNALESSATFEQGDIVKVRGQVCRYQERIQVNVEQIRGALEGEYELGDFLPKTSRDIDAMWAELAGYVESFTDPDLKALLRAFLSDPEIAAALHQAPAARSMHHAWIGGLLEHVLSLLGLCDITAKHYPHVHRDLLLSGAMLHDIGKLYELRWATGFEYTHEGTLLGHITIGIGMIDRKIAALPAFPAALRLLLLHVILSHHGRYEFGSPKLPMIPEAMLFSYLDDLDAKMQSMRNEFEKSSALGRPQGEFTDWVRALERPLLDTSGFLAAAADKAGKQ